MRRALVLSVLWVLLAVTRVAGQPVAPDLPGW